MTEPYVGEIRFFGYDFPVRGWALCQGQTLAVNQNQALFALIGTTFGGNGVTTFNLPDLRSRVPVGMGQSPADGQQYTWGQKAGTETVTLTTSQIPQHVHFLQGTTTTADKRPPFGRTFGADTSDTVDYFAAAGAFVQMNPGSIANAGGSQPHPNIQPYSATNASIALQGLFPSRN